MLHAASHMLLQKILAKFGYKLDMKVKIYVSILLYYWLPIGTYDKKIWQFESNFFHNLATYFEHF